MSDGVFLDTSAVYAVFDGDDASHDAVAGAWRDLVASDAPLHTTNYVLVELEALLQRRLGIEAVDALAMYLAPFVNVLWVDERLHAQASAALLAARRRDVSLVDHTSFIVMRSLGLRSALTVDRHFVEQGFRAVPGV
jgi:predicted nucleic acid-binding protein